jgi:hypothetical protein
MNSKSIEEIANAVLYEGYMLYPYRASAVKNRQRWNFGVVYPRFYSDAQGGVDPCFMQTECLIACSESSVVDIKVRFLQGISRRIAKFSVPLVKPPENPVPPFEFVDSLRVGEKLFQPWQEAVEREIALPSTRPADLTNNGLRTPVNLSSGENVEPIQDESGLIHGLIIRTRASIDGEIEASASKRGDGMYRLHVAISNLTAPDDTQINASREQAILKSFLSAHTVLAVREGEFVSLIDPPPEFQHLVSECRNIGTWPVLAGDEGSRNAMLSSPIILYDYPQIAPESPGDLFDGTEIDEILALRILTLTEDEKSELRQTDDRASAILRRTEELPPEHFLKLHGALRGMKPAIEDDASHSGGRQ